MKGGFGGEFAEIQGGHIVRSTCRKDRHSKVCTAKGPKDRRVRLSAHTAIQFYDVQDRLGYDRPSMAVDWLIKNAKSAIDELADLPPWHPTTTTVAAGATSDPSLEMDDSGGKGPPVHMGESAASSAFSFGGSSSFLPPPLESDAIADTIKFFFPISSGGGGGPSSITTAAAPSSSTPTEFHQYPPDLLSRSNSHVQDIRLSLQTFQDPILLHHHHYHQQQHPPQQLSAVTEQSFFGNSLPTWSEQNQRLLHWGGSNETGGGSITITAASGGNASSGSYMFNQMSQPQGVPLPLHPVLGQSPFLTQRGSLQSNNSPSILAWTDPTVAAMMSGSSTGFASGSLSGFRIPARIQGEEEHEDDVGISRKPSSAPRR